MREWNCPICKAPCRPSSAWSHLLFKHQVEKGTDQYAELLERGYVKPETDPVTTTSKPESEPAGDPARDLPTPETSGAGDQEAPEARPFRRRGFGGFRDRRGPARS